MSATFSHFSGAIFFKQYKKNLNDKIGLGHFIYFDTAKVNIFYREEGIIG
jgi:hypothetical protein